MKQQSARTSLVVAALIGALAVALAAVSAQSGPPAPQMTQEAYKNIQVLKDVPADELIPSMQFISASLGVDCDFCHVPRQFEKDDKKPKQVARKMMQMTSAINKDNFDGKREVTCNSCHRGNTDPVGTPAISAEEPPPATKEAARAETKTAAIPSADQILNKYVEALGGVEAIQKITSRMEMGTMDIGHGRSFPVDIFAKAPDTRVSVMHTANGDNITGFDGKGGWLAAPARPTRDMAGAELDAARMDADLHFPIHIKQLFSDLRVWTPAKIGDRDAYVLLGMNTGKPPVELYFDEQTGLLVRMVRYADTPLGRNPTQIDYSDYRDSGGAKTPFRWTIARPGNRFSIQVQEVRVNVEIEPRKIARPKD
jgi:photosynthetic reaction center cytochrome c subunit